MAQEVVIFPDIQNLKYMCIPGINMKLYALGYHNSIFLFPVI